MPTLDWLNRDAAFKIAKDVPYRLLEAVSEHVSSTVRAELIELDVPNSSAGSAPSPAARERVGVRAAASVQSSLELTSSSRDSDKLDATDVNHAINPHPSPLPEGEGTKPASVDVKPTHNNLLIQGDNLEALKALLPFYRGQIKCIFIDPPYNTKSAFEHYDDNLEHAQWLSMMLPRLQLLRELLREEGSIWVTIDDNEGHYLKVMMDEVFGRGNFVANVVWEKKFAPQANSIGLSDSHDHVHVYARSAVDWRANLLPRHEAAVSRYKNPDNDPRGPWMSDNFTISLSGGQRGAQYAKTGVSTNLYEIRTPGGKLMMPSRGRCWRVTHDKFLQLVADNRIWFGEDGLNVPRYKTFLAEAQDGIVAKTLWHRDEVGDNQDAKREAMKFNDGEVFSTPKPERLLQRIIHIATNPNDLILDSFLGSGTTAAVAQKMGRRWIGIEMGEHAKTHCLPRLQKVLDGEQGGISKTVNWQGGGSFRFMQLGAPVFDETGAIHAEVRFATLAAFVWMQETRTPWAGTTRTVRPEPVVESGGTQAHGSTSSPRTAGGSPYLGTHDGVAYYLLFNGILGDRRPQGGNVLTSAILAFLNAEHPHPNAGGPRVIYGESVRLGPARLAAENITFKQIPYDVARG